MLRITKMQEVLGGRSEAQLIEFLKHRGYTIPKLPAKAEIDNTWRMAKETGIELPDVQAVTDRKEALRAAGVKVMSKKERTWMIRVLAYKEMTENPRVPAEVFSEAAKERNLKRKMGIAPNLELIERSLMEGEWRTIEEIISYVEAHNPFLALKNEHKQKTNLKKIIKDNSAFFEVNEEGQFRMTRAGFMDELRRRNKRNKGRL